MRLERTWLGVIRTKLQQATVGRLLVWIAAFCNVTVTVTVLKVQRFLNFGGRGWGSKRGIISSCIILSMIY